MVFSDTVRTARVTAAFHAVGVHLRPPPTFSSANEASLLERHWTTS